MKTIGFNTKMVAKIPIFVNIYILQNVYEIGNFQKFQKIYRIWTQRP